jgi:hypothetical protein
LETKSAVERITKEDYQRELDRLLNAHKLQIINAMKNLLGDAKLAEHLLEGNSLRAAGFQKVAVFSINEYGLPALTSELPDIWLKDKIEGEITVTYEVTPNKDRQEIIRICINNKVTMESVHIIKMLVADILID